MRFIFNTIAVALLAVLVIGFALSAGASFMRRADRMGWQNPKKKEAGLAEVKDGR